MNTYTCICCMCAHISINPHHCLVIILESVHGKDGDNQQMHGRAPQGSLAPRCPPPEPLPGPPRPPRPLPRTRGPPPAGTAVRALRGPPRPPKGSRPRGPPGRQSGSLHWPSTSGRGTESWMGRGNEPTRQIIVSSWKTPVLDRHSPKQKHRGGALSTPSRWGGVGFGVGTLWDTP